MTSPTTFYVGKTKVVIKTDCVKSKKEQEKILEKLNRINRKIWDSLTPDQQLAWNEKEYQ